MFDHKKARDLGWIEHCDQPISDPVTVAGTYSCITGHAHSVFWSHGFAHVSAHGYMWAFLAAIDTADDTAIARADPESPEYKKIYDEVLQTLGYGAVCLSN